MLKKKTFLLEYTLLILATPSANIGALITFQRTTQLNHKISFQNYPKQLQLIEQILSILKELLISRD